MIMALMSLLTLTGMAQQNDDERQGNISVMDARYCMSYDDYVNNQWQTVEKLQRITRTEGQLKWSGGGLYRFKKEDKEFDKKLKKEVFAIEFGDTLYINLYGLKHKGAYFGIGYNSCYRMENKIVFTENYVSKKKNMAIGALAGAGGVFAGAIGGLAVGLADYSIHSQWAKHVCYIVDNNTKKVTLIDQETMPSLLADHPDLLSKYDKVEGKKEKRSAATVMPLLLKAGIIK